MTDRRPFWEKVQRGGDDQCWPWTGFKKSSGHGATTYKSRPIHASRKAWILTHGPISSQVCVNHTCDNSACCNPKHMYLGTRSENMVDRWAKTPPAERTFGRSRVLTQEQLAELWDMRKRDVRLTVCAEKFGVHIATICRYITEIRREKVKQLQAVRLSAHRV